MTWWIWVLIGFGLLVLELSTTTMHVGFFAIGAFVTGLLIAVGLNSPLWAQILIFVGSSLVAFFWLRPILMRKLKLDKKNVVDTLVGEAAIAMEEIPASGLGKAEMRGTTWSARNVGESVLARGQRCVVTDVEGLMLHVRAS